MGCVCNRSVFRSELHSCSGTIVLSADGGPASNIIGHYLFKERRWDLTVSSFCRRPGMTRGACRPPLNYNTTSGNTTPQTCRHTPEYMITCTELCISSGCWTRFVSSFFKSFLSGHVNCKQTIITTMTCSGQWRSLSAGEDHCRSLGSGHADRELPQSNPWDPN